MPKMDGSMLSSQMINIVVNVWIHLEECDMIGSNKVVSMMAEIHLMELLLISGINLETQPSAP